MTPAAAGRGKLMMQERKNIGSARIIERGIAIDAAKGTAHAWVFLLANGIPKHIVARVLARSARRRASDARNAVIYTAGDMHSG